MSNYFVGPDGGLYSENELRHYGILGMKWGVRRTPEQLGRKVSKLRSQNQDLKEWQKQRSSDAERYTIKSNAHQQKNAKYNERIAKATAKKAKYDLKVDKQLSKFRPNESKLAKYQLKSAKYQREINKAKKKLQYNKWAMKASDATADALIAKQKIEKNEKLINTFESTIKAINSGTIQQGRYFMKYVDD